MAIVQNPLIGQTRGSAADVIFQYYNGKQIMRRKPCLYIDAQTPAQVANRTKFSAEIIRYEPEFNEYLPLFYPVSPLKVSRYNMLQKNLDRLIVSTLKNRWIDNTPCVVGNRKTENSFKMSYTFSSFGAPHVRITFNLISYNVVSDFFSLPSFVVIAIQPFTRELKYISFEPTYTPFVKAIDLNITAQSWHKIIMLAALTDSNKSFLPGSTSLIGLDNRIF